MIMKMKKIKQTLLKVVNAVLNPSVSPVGIRISCGTFVPPANIEYAIQTGRIIKINPMTSSMPPTIFSGFSIFMANELFLSIIKGLLGSFFTHETLSFSLSMWVFWKILSA